MNIRANGIEIAYDISGQGPWMVLNHSLGVDRSVWWQQVPDFAKTHRVLTWDARGHGESSKVPGPYDFDMMAQDLNGLLDTLGIERTAVLGLSMGGDIAMAVASSRPERVSALVLCDTTPQFGPEGRKNWRARIDDARREGISGAVEGNAQRWFTEDCRTSHPEIADRVLDIFRRTDLEGYIGTMGALATVDLLPRLGVISCPTMLVYGKDDPATGLGVASLVNESIKGSKLVVLENARHLAPIEQAKAFNQAVLQFLAEVGV